jgi:hypothetical protein
VARGRTIGGALALLLIWSGLLCAAPALSASSPVGYGFSRAEPIVAPGAFYVRGSNDYVISVVAEPGVGKRPNRAMVVADGPNGRVFYRAPANLVGDGIRVDLGPAGRIALAWKPDGRVGKGSGRCYGRPFHRYFAEGSYVGTVAIRGEEDFTEVNARRVRGRTGWFPYLSCGFIVREGFPGPGVLLDAFRATPGSPDGAGHVLSIVQNRPDGAVGYLAAMAEKLGSILIEREAFAIGRARSLSFDSRFESARVTPPAPFSGSAIFERVDRGRPGTWRGDLAVDFPGHAAFPLAGPQFEATFKSGFREASTSRAPTGAKLVVER